MQLRSRNRTKLEKVPIDLPKNSLPKKNKTTKPSKAQSIPKDTTYDEVFPDSELSELESISSQETHTEVVVDIQPLTRVKPSVTPTRKSTRQSTKTPNTRSAKSKSNVKRKTSSKEPASPQSSESADLSQELDSDFGSDLSDFEPLPKSTPRKRGKATTGQGSTSAKKRKTPTKNNRIDEVPISPDREIQSGTGKLKSERRVSPPPLPTPIETNSEEAFDLELDLNPDLNSDSETPMSDTTPIRKRSSDIHLKSEETQKKQRKSTQSTCNDVGNLDNNLGTGDTKIELEETVEFEPGPEKTHSTIKKEQNAVASTKKRNVRKGKATDESMDANATDKPQLSPKGKSSTVVKSKFFENSDGAVPQIPRKVIIRSQNTLVDDTIQKENIIKGQPGGSSATVSAELPVTETKETELHDHDEDSEEEEDWEEVAVPGKSEDNSVTITESQMSVDESSNESKFKTLTITLDTPKVKQRVKSSGLSRMERLIRLETHKTHLLCLLANGSYRNQICNNAELRSFSLSILPQEIYKPLCLETRKDTVIVKHSRFLAALEKLTLWWGDYFEVVDSESRAEGSETIADSDTIEHSMDIQHLVDSFSYPRGDSEISTQLFVSLCRAIGLSARLVISFQPSPLKSPGNSKEAGSSDVSSSASSPKVSRKSPKKKEKVKSAPNGSEKSVMKYIKDGFTTSRSKYFGPNGEVSGETPLFWAEVLSPYNNKWISIDCVRGLVNRVAEMEPPADSPHSLAYVVAFESDASAKDVTRRYTRQWGAKTRKLRVPVAKDGYDWWAETLIYYAREQKTQADELEDAELLSCEVSEAMPTSIAAFNNHPLYVLERHLKKFEVLHPKEPVIGHIRGECIYPRSCVKETHTTETWLKEGRTVKSGEEPIKYVKARVVTINKQRMHNMMAMDSGEAVEPQSGLYGIWQTEEYKPPPVVDGKVPKNNYGNIDLYKDSMLPEGAVHLPFKGIAKIAKKLGIDYAEAVVGFDFHCRRCIPVVNGIVAPKESREIIMEAYEEYQRNKEEKEFTKLEIAALSRWRKMITGLRIHHRLKEEYGNHTEEELIDEVDDTSVGQTEVAAEAPSPEVDTGGGFFL